MINNYRSHAKKLAYAAGVPIKKIRLEHRHFEVKWDEEGFHILPAIRLENGFFAWCIYCDKWHIHGAGDGHRVAHCYDDVNTTSEVRQIWCTFLVKNYTSSCEKGRFGV